jgi:hypothetical protein
MEDPNVGEPCVAGLNVSQFVTPKPYSGQKTAAELLAERVLVTVSLRASSGVNFCSPFVSAEVSMAVSYSATPSPSATYIPTPSPSYPRTFPPTRHPTPKPSERGWPWKDVRVIGGSGGSGENDDGVGGGDDGGGGGGGVEVGHCMPFGRGDDASYGRFKGFVYKNLPPLGTLRSGDVLAFDLAATNDFDLVFDIWLANTTYDGR